MQPSVAPQRGWLRRTLPGEYVALVLMLHAGIGALLWAMVAVSSPAGWLVVAAGGWVHYRAAGGFAPRYLAPLVSGGLLVSLLVLRQASLDLPSPGLAVFSLPVFVGMLALVLVLDLAELSAPPSPQR